MRIVRVGMIRVDLYGDFSEVRIPGVQLMICSHRTLDELLPNFSPWCYEYLPEAKAEKILKTAETWTKRHLARQDLFKELALKLKEAAQN